MLPFSATASSHKNMTPEERQEVDRLIEPMKDEKDLAKFLQHLLRRFQEIIQRKEERLKPQPK